MSGPLDSVGGIKVKLGALVAASVVAASLVATVGARAGVPVWLTVPVSVALALGVTQLLAVGMTAPLREMTEAARRMSAGDYSGRVLSGGADEVGALATAFNRMAADLARVDEQRREMIATVSHELRTPLTAMTAVLENLADGVVPPDGPHLEEALGQAERLSGLVTDLLDLSRLEAGVMRLDARPVPLRELVQECVQVVSGARGGADVDVDVDDDLVVPVDRRRLAQLLTNAIDNAVRHHRGDEPVRVRAGRGADHWWLEVLDDGPGVPPAQRERAFQRWDADPETGGTGLGLAIGRWVAQLHGGTLHFRDPGTAAGARLRLEVPRQVPGPAPSPPAAAAVPPLGPAAVAPARAPLPAGPMDALFGRFWPEERGSDGLRIVVASAGVGLLAGMVMTFAAPGLSWLLVLVAAGAAAYVTARRRREPFTVACTVLAFLLVLPIALLAQTGVAMLGVLAAAAVFLVGVTGARTILGIVLSGVAWPLASLRGLPWFGRSLRLVGTGGRTPAVVRTVFWSLLGLAVFGTLFASADALFATWVDAVVPSWTFTDLVARAFVAVAVFGLTLAAAYLAWNPAQVEPASRPVGAGSRFEWLVPVLLVDGVFLLFLLAQAAAVFGGHDYVQRATGLTYADYVHQGFGQLTVATALTLLVVWAAARRAGDTPGDRAWMRLSLGLLCALALVVVASALYRMHVYQEAYGFTLLRVLVDVFEGWLGVVVLSVAVLGGLGRGRWVPRVALVSGACAVLALAALNPDAWVAGRNLDRYEATGRLDLSYLADLSADAAPVIEERLPREVAACVLHDLVDEEPDGLLAWNLGRERAREVVERLDPPTTSEPYAPPEGCAQVWRRFEED